MTERPLIYVTRDIERALGREPKGQYFVISNDSAYGRSVKARFPDNVWLVEPETPGVMLDTFDLLSLPSVATAIREQDADLLVFQPTPRIERLAVERGWHLLNPSADLAKRVEEKVSQVAWLKKDASLLPPHRIAKLKDVEFTGARFVIQFNHSHTGEGTYVIDADNAATVFADLKSKFPDRECRVVDFIDGPVFTLNTVAGTFVTTGAISYQITGLRPFTDMPFATVGNDWALPRAILSSDEQEHIYAMAKRVGKLLKADGWKGLFGIDVIKDAKSGAIYLLEINARQPASTTYESELQKKMWTKTTIFDAHIAALLGPSWKVWSLAHVKDGAQIVKRVTSTPAIVDVAKLSQKGLRVISYENTEANKELYRIQSAKGILKGPGELNELGQFISSCIL